MSINGIGGGSFFNVLKPFNEILPTVVVSGFVLFLTYIILHYSDPKTVISGKKNPVVYILM